MSTRSHIGIWNEDGSLDAIYCHWDGYPSYNGALLLHHYQDPEKIRELIALGDITARGYSAKQSEGGRVESRLPDTDKAQQFLHPDGVS